MSLLKNRKFQVIAAALAIPGVVFLLFSLKQPGKKVAGTGTVDTSPEGFTFLDLHANSILTPSVRGQLSDKLGAEAVETSTHLDLEANYPGFLQKYFAELHELNQKLNYVRGIKTRVEHDILKLTYRYPSSFEYVELYFSNENQKPLFFRIKAKKEGPDIIEAVRGKYGKPDEINWDDATGRSLYWKQQKDVLIISVFPDRYGNPQYQVVIYHVKNIETLLAAEEKKARQKEEERSRAGKAAF